MPSIEQQVDIARTTALLAHKGQVDKGGEPYFLHPQRVAKSFHPTNDKNRIVVAWLHDVLEDSEVTVGDLKDAGIDEGLIVNVIALTRKKGQPNEEYYAAIRDMPVALAVKLADIKDNLDPIRLSKLPDADIVRLVKKYAYALEVLNRGTQLR